MNLPHSKVDGAHRLLNAAAGKAWKQHITGKERAYSKISARLKEQRLNDFGVPTKVTTAWAVSKVPQDWPTSCSLCICIMSHLLAVLDDLDRC